MKVFLKSFKDLFKIKMKLKKKDFSWRARNEKEKESQGGPLTCEMCRIWGRRYKWTDFLLRLSFKSCVSHALWLCGLPHLT